MPASPLDHIRLDTWIDGHFDEELRFLQSLIQIPTDTPPGNNAPHAERAYQTRGDAGSGQRTDCPHRH